MKNTPHERAALLISECRTLQLATVSETDDPTSSYAPYVKHEDSHYIYTSSLSQHTRDLLKNPRASVMFIEDEALAPNIFARKRYTCQCAVIDVPRECEIWHSVMRVFEKRFGKVFDQIKPLGDFTLFRLDLGPGRYIEGFGRAYEIDAHMLKSVHVTGAHKPKKKPRLK